MSNSNSLQLIVDRILDDIRELELQITKETDKQAKIFLAGILFGKANLVLELKREYKKLDLKEFDSKLSSNYLNELWKMVD